MATNENIQQQNQFQNTSDNDPQSRSGDKTIPTDTDDEDVLENDTDADIDDLEDDGHNANNQEYEDALEDDRENMDEDSALEESGGTP